MASNTRYFTHYCSKETYRNEAWLAGEPFNHTAGNLFRKRDVKSCDFVYSWSFSEGRLLLGARMQVDRLVSQKEANALYKEGAWEAADHVVAKARTGTRIRYDRPVPASVIRKLKFISSNGIRPPKFNRAGKVDPQTFRGVRELTRESAALLDGLLEEKTHSR